MSSVLGGRRGALHRLKTPSLVKKQTTEQCGTFDFMEMIIFILAYSRVKLKKQGIVPFRAISTN